MIKESIKKLNETNTGKILNEILDKTLREYLKSLIIKNQKTYSNQYIKIVIEILKKKVKEIEPLEEYNAINQFLRVPIIQMADGSNLLYDKETFMNNFLFQISCRENHLRYLFTQQCSTIKSLMYPSKLIGPSYIELDSDIYKLFNKSKNQLANSNIATLENVDFVFEPQGIKMPLYAQSNLPDILQGIKGMHFKRASSAINYANRIIWKNLKMKSKKILLQFDEDLSVEVLEHYLRKDCKPIINLLFNKKIRNSFINTKKEIIKSKENLILNDTSDFFYYKTKNSLQPVKINKNKLIKASNREIVPIGLNKKDIIKALKDKILYPDLIFTYLILIILPNIKSFGGASQQEYLPIIKRIFCETNKKNKFLDEKDYTRILNQENLCFIGYGLVELSKLQKRVIGNLNKNTNLDEFEKEFIDKKMNQNLGNLSYFDYFEIFYKKKY